MDRFELVPERIAHEGRIDIAGGIIRTRSRFPGASTAALYCSRMEGVDDGLALSPECDVGAITLRIPSAGTISRNWTAPLPYAANASFAARQSSPRVAMAVS
ncbi:hypothetical protein ATE71_00640 [Sphingopyxis sp. H115]|nr:hypothetical protein ATE71_00640 [Sphingopyxis sp. H115]